MIKKTFNKKQKIIIKILITILVITILFPKNSFYESSFFDKGFAGLKKDCSCIGFSYSPNVVSSGATTSKKTCIGLNLNCKYYINSHDYREISRREFKTIKKMYHEEKKELENKLVEELRIQRLKNESQN